MARKRRRRRSEETPYELVDEDEGGSPRRRRRRGRQRPRGPRWFRRLLVLLILLGVAVAAAPTVISRTRLRETALQWAGGKVGLQLQAAEVSAGWFSKTSANEVTIRDREGEPLLTAASLELDRSLLSLWRNQQDLGTLRLVGPVAHVAIGSDGNNWQRALGPLLQEESRDGPPRIQVEVVEGTVHVQDERRGMAWELGPVELTAAVDPRARKPLKGELTTLLADAAGNSGRLNLDLAADNLQLSAGQSQIRTEQLPLSLVETLLASSIPGLQLQGMADFDGTLNWDAGEAPRAALQMKQLQARPFVLRLPQLPPSDTIQLAELIGSGNVRWQDGKLQAENLQLASDVSQLTASGQLDLQRAAATLTDADQLRVTARVDVARLAGMLPATLRIRPDTQIDSGTVDATLDTRMEQGRRLWKATLNTSQLAATTAGRSVQWEQPVSVEIDATQRAGGWTVQRIDCLSSFLNLKGGGKPTGGRVDISTDLNRLRNELSQFVDLGDARLAGTAQGYLVWQQEPTGLVSNGRLDLNQFEVVLPGKAPLAEPQLALLFSARGRNDAARVTHVDQARLTVEAASDRLTAELLQPVARDAEQAAYPLRLQVKGDLGRWLMRAAVLSGNSQLRGEGEMDFDGRVTVSARQLVVSQSQLQAGPCRVFGLGPRIDEPQLQASVIGAYDFQTGRWVGGQTSVVSSTLAARCDNLRYDPAPTGATVSGDIAYRANLNRLLRTLSGAAVQRQFAGEINGQARLVQQPGGTQFEIRQRLENFAILHRIEGPLQTVSSTGGWQEAWKEPFLDLTTNGSYLADQGVLKLSQLEATADSVKLQLAGQLADLGGRLNADLQGQLQYDLKRLTTKIKPVTGNSILLEGVSQKPISIRGPLRQPPGQVAVGPQPLLPLDLLANAGFAWDTAVIEGFRIGPGEIRTSLQQGTVRFDTMQIPVSQGRVMLAPQIDFRASSPILTNPPGPVVENLTISPEMCRTWLKYVAPLLADTTRIQGSFSASMQQVAVPLTAPRQASLQGSLAMHGAQAGPGPLAQQLIGFVKQAERVVKSAGQGGASLDRALELLGNGGLLDPNGRIDPQRAIGNLLGGTPAAGAGANAVWMRVPEHAIAFQLAEGRVHHQQMRLVVDDVEIRTSGSVGMDESLALVAELPVPDKWLGDNPAVAVLRGQVLQIPIRGTVRRPQLDGSFLQQLARQLLNGAAGGALNRATGAVNGQLDRVLNPNGVAPPAAPGTAGAAGNGGAAGANNPLTPRTVIDNAAENVGQEVDRALRKIFNK